MNQTQEPQGAAKSNTGMMAAIAILALAVVGFLLSRSVGFGAELTVVDGKVEIQDGERWMEAREGDSVKAGTKLRTAEGKAVVSFDEGSAFRLDANTEIEVLEIGRRAIRVRNENGRAYSRVDATSGMTWTVEALETETVALGTAFAVSADKVKNKVAIDVLEHKVKVKVKKDDGTIEKEADEGTYLAIDLNKPVQDSVAEAEIKQKDAEKDPFLAWNFAQDEELVKEGNEEKNEEESTEADVESAGEVEKEPVAAAEPKPEPAPVEPKPAAPKPVAAAAIKLSGTTDDKGVHLTWKLLNGATASKGFKVVKSLDPNPTYPGSDATFVEAGKSSYTLYAKEGKTYHFRVCAYNGDGGCKLYSNDIALTVKAKTPNEQGAYESVGTELKLSGVRDVKGIVLDWTASGSSGFEGYKVVRSETNPNLFYPQDSYIKFQTDRGSTHYYDEGAVVGRSYYYRICALKSDGIPSCGNVVKIQ